MDTVAVGNAIWFCWQHRGYVQLLCGYVRLLASQDPLTVAVTALPVLRRMLQPARMVREWAQPRLLHLLNSAPHAWKSAGGGLSENGLSSSCSVSAPPARAR